MRKSIILVPALLLVAVLTAGCTGSDQNVTPDINSPEVTQNVKSDDIVQPETNYKSDSWCQTGSEYNSKSQAGEVSIKVIGITNFKDNSGKSWEVCETQSKASGTTTTYYSSQNNKFYYQIIKNDTTKEIMYEGGGNTP